MSRGEIEKEVGIREIAEDSITPLVTWQNFVVMPDAYYAFTFQKRKTCYQFVLCCRIYV